MDPTFQQQLLQQQYNQLIQNGGLRPPGEGQDTGKMAEEMQAMIHQQNSMMVNMMTQIQTEKVRKLKN